MFAPTQSFPMLALPFFILAGSLMMSGELGRNLIQFATILVQRYRGGLGSVTVVGSAVFGGVSGSAVADATALGSMRSEEHTSELQSLMRISYAVFCLKKKKSSTKH